MDRIGIIGGGPAGYVAAIVAAQQGQKVTLIEEKALGGTCLNEGCMPTKTLLESAEVLEQVKKAAHFGIKLNGAQVEIDWSKVQGNKNRIVQQLVTGISFLMKKNKIKVVTGKATFVSENKVDVDGQTIEADKFIIATGSEPINLPFAPFDNKWIIDSGRAMSLPEVPENLLIVGGGVIGCEFASIYSRLGSKVTIVEMADQLLPGEDIDVARVLQKELEKSGVIIHTSMSLKELKPDQHLAIIGNDQETIDLNPGYVLVSIGRKPRVNQLNLEGVGVSYSKHGIEVNENMQTSNPNIYACGDVVGGIQLAHVAFHEGTIAALHASGENAEVNYSAVPRCIYTSPEIAGVGLTEKQAKEKYGDIKIGEFPFSANGKALIMNQQIGKVKVIVEPQYGEIIGMSIIGPKATELIAQGALMLHSELTIDALDHFIAAHPTLSEAIHESLLNTKGRAIHS